MTDGKHIPTEKRWTTEGFMQRYEELCKAHDTYYAAYQATEAEHKALFGVRRYASYDSFRMTRKGMIK